MTRQAVVSSSLKSIGHDGDVLEVEFHSGKVYRYSGVAREHFDALIGAESIGKHFGEHVRGKYEHQLVETEDDGARA